MLGVLLTVTIIAWLVHCSIRLDAIDKAKLEAWEKEDQDKNAN